jgi:hypothetical protein
MEGRCQRAAKGPTPSGGVARGHPHTPMVCQPPGLPPALLPTSSHVGKNRGSGFVSSNSENISCVTFLKHKNIIKQGTVTVASHQYVSSGKCIKTP